MKTIKLLSVSVSLITVLFASNVSAIGLSDLAGAAGALQKGSQALQTGQAVTAIAQGAATGNGLTGLLVQKLGVTETQATGGAGAVFQFAKTKMENAAFAKLSASVPGMQGLLAAAPVAKSVGGGIAGNLASLAGQSGGSAGSLIGLAGSFQQLGLAPDMVQKFVPLVVQYVQGSSGGAVASVLESALMGGM